jgi:DNA-binding response OmpR family regulator
MSVTQASATNRTEPDDQGSNSNRGEPDAVLHDARQRFIAAFPGQCETLTALTRTTEADPSAAEGIAQLLHRMAGLAGTLGFVRVSSAAGRLETVFENPDADHQNLEDELGSLKNAFALDLAEPPQWASPVTAASPMTVLLVEDDEIQRSLMAAYLKRAGHTPVEVATGDRVIAAAREVRPSVILLDLELPAVDGHTVCRLLKADPTLASIPVVFLSAKTTLEARVTGLALGADDFLVKPVDPRELMLRMQLLHGRARQVVARQTGGELPYDAFRTAARDELQRNVAALVLVRTPAEQRDVIAAAIRGEIRRRDLSATYDRNHLAVLLPDMGAVGARERIVTIIEKLRAAGVTGVHAGVAASAVAGTRTLEALLDEADEALSIARYEDVPAALRPEGPRTAARVDRPTILIGDDDPEVARIIDAHVTAAGYRSVLAFDGLKTLEEVKAQRPDVLVIDLMMPRMTGFDVLAQIRNMPDGRPHVIVLSARGREEDVMRAFDLGADDYMTKPFSPQELLARIGRFLR